MITLTGLKAFKASNSGDAEVADACDGIVPEDVRESPIMQSNVIPEATPNYDNRVKHEIVEEKWMIVLTKYPGGRIYPKIFPIGSRILPKKKQVVKKQLEQTELGEEETY